MNKKIHTACSGPFISQSFRSGPLHMSRVTGLARLLGRILWSVNTGNFSPFDRDETQETKPKWCHTNLSCSRLS